MKILDDMLIDIMKENLYLSDELSVSIEAITQACNAIMSIYNQKKILKTYKDKDGSPVTKADKNANDILCQILKNRFSYPILSEESKDDLIRLKADRVWILDPLDGTKEFISRNGEFSVNLALVECGVCILGIVAYPLQNRIYYARKGLGAKVLTDRKSIPVHVNNKIELNNLNIAVSRSHLDNWTTTFLSHLKNYKQISLGSAMKYCAIAEGKIDITIRKTPLHEWDIAAADCILSEAGGVITNIIGDRFLYNKHDTLITSGIIASNTILHAKMKLIILNKSLANF